jgi:hypothetical protein
MRIKSMRNTMAKLVFRATLLFALVNISLPLHAQQGSVALSVCNAGKVAIDVFLAKGSHVASSHIVPGDCARVYSENAGLPAYVGFALVDSHGQWGAARRLDLLPDFGFRNPSAGPEEILNRADQNVSVRRGNRDVSMPMQLLFQPRVPKCTTYRSATERLSPFATDAERAEARRLDAMSPAETVCEDLAYTLNALAYPDSREITFNKFCDLCDKNEDARITPKERAAKQQRSDAVNQEIGSLEATGPLGALVMGNVVKQANQEAQEEEREREEERRQQQPESYQPMNWKEMNLALANVRPGGERPPEMPQYLIIRGTVSRVDVSLPGASEHWVNVYFRESAEQASNSYETIYGAFNVCTSNAEIFKDMFGPDFRLRMIGQVLEVEGEYQRNYCKGWKGSIRVTLGRQVHPGGSGRFATAARTWVRPSVPPPSATPPVQQETEMDPGMPSYSLTSKVASEEILQYCRGIYDPVFPLLTPEQNRIKNANRAAIETEVKKCASRFDATEVAPHRRIAMRYCLGHNDYTVPGQGARVKAYDECMYQNDILTAFCTRELKYRAELDHMPNVADQKCPAPRPNHIEALVIKNGGHDDIGHPVVIPSAGPGLPPILLAAMEPGTIQRAGGSTAANAVVPAAPVAAPSTIAPTTTAGAEPAAPAAAALPPSTAAAPRTRAAQGQVDRQQQIAERQKLAQRYAACQQEAVKAHPEGRAELAKAYTACIQAK